MVDDSKLEQNIDITLVANALKDVNCFSELVERYQKRLFYYIMKITNVRTEDAEDILQEVFLKVYRNLNDFDGRVKFSSWIYRITRNHVISEHRKREVRGQNNFVPIDEILLNTLASELSTNTSIDIEYLNKNIHKILDNIDQKYSEVLILKFFEEKSYQEISDIIKKPMGTIATLINRAKKRFIKEFNKQNLELT